MKFEVTQEDIETSNYFDNTDCAIARAVKRKLPILEKATASQWGVGGRYLRIGVMAGGRNNRVHDNDIRFSSDMRPFDFEVDDAVLESALRRISIDEDAE